MILKTLLPVFENEFHQVRNYLLPGTTNMAKLMHFLGNVVFPEEKSLKIFKSFHFENIYPLITKKLPTNSIRELKLTPMKFFTA